jgi:hypothetical protein
MASKNAGHALTRAKHFRLLRRSYPHPDANAAHL